MVPSSHEKCRTFYRRLFESVSVNMVVPLSGNETQTRANQFYQMETLVKDGLTSAQCRDLYLDLRRFYREKATAGSKEEARKILTEYAQCDVIQSKADGPTCKRIMIRTGIVIGCVLVHDVEGHKEVFPSRENESRYPEGYEYTYLDMAISKSWNNDAPSRAEPSLKGALHVMYDFHMKVKQRASKGSSVNENTRQLGNVRQRYPRLVHFKADDHDFMIYSNRTWRGRVDMVAKVVLVHIMYTVYGPTPEFLSTKLYKMATLPENESPVPIVDITAFNVEIPDGDKRSEMMELWNKAVTNEDNGIKWTCPCNTMLCDHENRFRYGDLPFDICERCFHAKVQTLREYVQNDDNRSATSRRFDFEHLFTTLFPGN